MSQPATFEILKSGRYITMYFGWPGNWAWNLLFEKSEKEQCAAASVIQGQSFPDNIHARVIE